MIERMNRRKQVWKFIIIPSDSTVWTPCGVFAPFTLTHPNLFHIAPLVKCQRPMQQAALAAANIINIQRSCKAQLTARLSKHGLHGNWHYLGWLHQFESCKPPSGSDGGLRSHSSRFSPHSLVTPKGWVKNYQAQTSHRLNSLLCLINSVIIFQKTSTLLPLWRSKMIKVFGLSWGEMFERQPFELLQPVTYFFSFGLGTKSLRLSFL